LLAQNQITRLPIDGEQLAHQATAGLVQCAQCIRPRQEPGSRFIELLHDPVIDIDEGHLAHIRNPLDHGLTILPIAIGRVERK
jgi:hypothetical protein